MSIPALQVVTAETVAQRMEALASRIRSAGADPKRIKVVGVTKGFGPRVLAAASQAGISDFGENYAQELLGKAASAPKGARWHFIGRIQRNKVRLLAPYVYLWQGVSRPEEGLEIARRAPRARVLVEVAHSASYGRTGCMPDQVPALVAYLRGLQLDVEGLMAVAPVPSRAVRGLVLDKGPIQGDKDTTFTPKACLEDLTEARDAFRLTRSIADQLGLEVVSMGMSEDLEVAVEEGSTMVRVGRMLFGDRPMAAKGAISCEKGGN
ncbi:MAG: YggS family pyridoxal phosphate enzyme [Actinobacteria bacterium]|nr:YggS family pyridoxal phosphate enzyme [Actinomycetota bacterium]